MLNILNRKETKNMTDSQTKVYINAYIVRLENGETLEDIDKSFIDMGRLTQFDCDRLHEMLPL